MRQAISGAALFAPLTWLAGRHAGGDAGAALSRRDRAGKTYPRLRPGIADAPQMQQSISRRRCGLVNALQIKLQLTTPQLPKSINHHWRHRLLKSASKLLSSQRNLYFEIEWVLRL